MKFDTEFERRLRDEQKELVEIVEKTGMDKLAEKVVSFGVEPYKKKIDAMETNQRVFFYYYVMHRSIVRGKYKYAAEIHGDFIVEMIKAGKIKELRNFIFESANPDAGAFSYAAEVSLKTLNEQIDKCKNKKNKKELEDIFYELRRIYQINKVDLEKRWMMYRLFEEYSERKRILMNKLVFIIEFVAVVVFAWIIGSNLSNIYNLLMKIKSI